MRACARRDLAYPGWKQRLPFVPEHTRRAAAPPRGLTLLPVTADLQPNVAIVLKRNAVVCGGGTRTSGWWLHENEVGTAGNAHATCAMLTGKIRTAETWSSMATRATMRQRLHFSGIAWSEGRLRPT